MMGSNGCCGHGGKDDKKGDMSEWKEKYAKMSDSEKKEMLEKKMAWVKEELEKLSK